MKKHLQLSVLALGLSAITIAQNQDRLPYTGKRTCGTEVPPAVWDEYFNKVVEEYKADIKAGRRAAASYTIPVIVHVVHGGENIGTFPNISNAQVNSQIPVLNADFAGTGLNSGNLAATAFSAVGAANCEITFCMATKDPQGNALATPGIERINYTTQGWQNPYSYSTFSSYKNYMETVVKPASIWDPQYYLNVWLVNQNINQVNILGYATFPAGTGLPGVSQNLGTATTDGIYVYPGCWGNTGILIQSYDKGRTASHEVGHWLGLRHIGGDGNGAVAGDCGATDYCADTPPQKGGYAGGQYGQNYGAPSYPLHVNDCAPNDPNGDMFMNFMDYCDDIALYMFTPDQKSRMQAAMSQGTYRFLLSPNAFDKCGNPTGMNERSIVDAAISLVPNPSKGQVKILSAYALNQSIEVTVMNSLGQTVAKMTPGTLSTQEISLDLSFYPSGVYFVVLDNGAEKVVKRLVLSK